MRDIMHFGDLCVLFNIKNCRLQLSQTSKLEILFDISPLTYFT